ncbi:uncharacterized protein LOC142541717 isoform X2 [Primulina tabacum]|uniref:uncharacterized protein LOC142541717 isoform X2 n=1 Tax=Primulina tabacum TaxID=48773 RepID=UPI003F5A0B1C
MANNLSQNRMPSAKGAIDAPVNDVSKAYINQGGINLGEPKDSVSANRLPIKVKILSIQLLFPSAQNAVVNGQTATGSRAGQLSTGDCAGRAAFASVPLAQVVTASFQSCQAAVFGWFWNGVSNLREGIIQ